MKCEKAVEDFAEEAENKRDINLLIKLNDLRKAVKEKKNGC